MKDNNRGTSAEESIWSALSRPFSARSINVKVLTTNKDKTRGLVVPYLTSREVMDRLDEVLGPAGWSDSYETLPDGSVRCRLCVSGVTKEDVGVAGAGNDPKAAHADALKRTSVKFGVGRYLYASNTVWSELTENGKIANPEAVKLKVLGLRADTLQKLRVASPDRRFRSSDELAHPHGDL